VLINKTGESDISDSSVRPESLGPHYGFHRNPYDPSPLGVEEGDSELFVGRSKEGLVFRTFLESFDRGALFVEGGVGVGKTSFVNVQEYRSGRGAVPRSLLPTRQPIQLASTLSPTEFLLSVLSNVLNSLQRTIPRVERAPRFRKLSSAVAQSIVKTRGWEVSAAGFGGGITTDATVSNPLLVLLPAVSELLDEAAKLATEFGYHRLAVNVNNLDVIDGRTLVSFLDITRDYTLTRAPFLWIFIGPIGSRAMVAQRSRRVSELVRSDPIWLPPLTLKEVFEAIDARVKRFRVDSATSVPITKEVVQILYESSMGEVRYILNRCTDLLMNTLIEFPTTREISLDLARPLLREMTSKAIGRCNLTPKQGTILSKLANNGPCQPRDYREFGFENPPAFLRYLSLFYALGLVDRRRRGKDVVYTPRGDVVLALAKSQGPLITGP
jgi:hypothetical protein